MYDLAIGTVGFLISSYKHILSANTDAKGNSALTPDEKGRTNQEKWNEYTDVIIANPPAD
jgi:type I restriction-modification system DNA methylase subunit